MKTLLYFLLSFLLLAPMAMADNGLVHVKSVHDVKTTADRLEKILNEKGMTLFNRIDHTAGAQKVGHTLRQTELLIFGNPNVGTPLMLCSQTAAIDLPQKALIWEDKSGQVWFSYNNPKYIKHRHNVNGCDDVIGKIGKALGNFAKAATMP
jgi:uncharacterized protein (DUF302 family)